MPIAISRYAAIVYSCPIPIWLSRFNAFRNLSVVYLRLLGSAGHMCDDTASFSYTNASNRCWNGNTNYKYYTTNLPTSRGKYWWIMLTSLLTLYPLWYRVTNTTIPSLINMLRCPPLIVLLCWTLNILGSLASWPLAICINTANFFWNLTTRPMYCLTASRSTPERAPGFMNLSWTRASLSTRSNNYLSPSTGIRVR
jgi:hypothetical protein